MKIWRGLAAICSVVLALTGCASPATPAGTGTLTVEVAFYPFQFVVERVGGDAVSVTSLTAPGSEPHDLELTPKQVASLGTADLVVYQVGFQPAVDTAVEQAKPARVVDTASFLTMRSAGAEPSEQEGTAGTSGLDPHTWLDPTNMVTIAEHVRDALTEARPEQAATFAANTRRLVDDLNTLDGDIKADLTGCAIQPFITSHAAFGYFAARYGLTQVGIRGLEPDVEPSASRIAEVQQIARDNHVTTIFFEALVSPVVAQSVAGDLGLRTDVLDPLEGITADSRGTDYREVMRANANSLKVANQCS
ncbi:MAG TPA: metal ABC transporter substrate-binding protein [Propionicimonas sp.]|uniref:metal ABC transporter substrate-binding protein n=1 Tax=Propionicimonas sp. TaxID=1955623 RepID=UPI002F41A47D